MGLDYQGRQNSGNGIRRTSSDMTTHTSSTLRVRIAEAQGYTDIRKEKMTHVDYDSRSVSEWRELRGTLNRKRERLPNWPNDLNACATFEATLNQVEQETYVTELMDVLQIPRSHCTLTANYYRLISAPPLSRCLAFIAVKGEKT